MVGIGIAPVALSAQLKPVKPPAPHESAPAVVVIHRTALEKAAGPSYAAVFEACQSFLGGRPEGILDAGEAYQKEKHRSLEVESFDSKEALDKARWLRNRLRQAVSPGGTVVLVGDEKSVPTWSVRIGNLRLTSDAFYADLNADGIPETSVVRVMGSPDQILRQLTKSPVPGPRALILCSEDTRIHQETRDFAKLLSGLGYEVTIRGGPDEKALAGADLIIHFGHGSPSGIYNRFGEPFAIASTLPKLPRAPLVFVDGCGTLPVGSPLLEAFLEEGAVAYSGATETVMGMTPSRFTNELVEHYLRILADRVGLSLPRALLLARAAYVRGHPGLAESLRQLADEGVIQAEGEDATHLLTVTEWVYYGNPQASLPSVGPPKPLTRSEAALEKPVVLEASQDSWRASFAVRPEDGQAVLALRAEVPLSDRRHFQLTVWQNGQAIAELDALQDTVYQNLGQECRGGHVSRDTYQARYLLPLPAVADGEREVEVRLSRGTNARLTMGTEIDIWPPDFEKRIGLKQAAAPSRRERPRQTRNRVSVVAEASWLKTDRPGFKALNLAGLCNRSHASIRVGGGDNASFKTWFDKDQVAHDGVPFLVGLAGRDVLVSSNNTENVFEIRGLNLPARALHLLLWGYNRPRLARLEVKYEDGTVQLIELPLREWTEAGGPVAFDFENSVSGFRHAAVTHPVLKLEHPDKPMTALISRSGTYGLIAVTAEQAAGDQP
jgi:Peptidase family C25